MAAESGKGAVEGGEEVVLVEDEVVSEVSTEVGVDEEVEVKMMRFLVEDVGGSAEIELDLSEGVGVDLEIDEEGAVYLGAGTGVERVLAGGGLEAEDGERDVGWGASGRKEGVADGDGASDCALEVTSCLHCAERTRRRSSFLKLTLTSQWPSQVLDSLAC